MRWDLALVVGYGSIGKRHVVQLEKQCHRIWVVDPRDVQGEIPDNATSYRSLNELKLNNHERKLGVIANWGPNHLETLKELAQMGISDLILEKPMTTSLSELLELQILRDRFGLNIFVNQGWNYSNFYRLVSKTQEAYALGTPKAIWSIGGARCVSTAGSHIFHVANRLFDSPAISYTAALNFQKINPRSELLDYVDGSASIEYESGAKLGMNFTNQSSLEGMTSIYWRNHVAEVKASGQFEIKSNLNLVKPTEKVTRYAVASQKIYDSQDEQVPVEIDNMYSIHKILQQRSLSSLETDFAKHYRSAFDLLMIMNSGVEKRTLYPDDSADNLILNRKFLIS